jgi:hypothetical protein
MYYNRYKIDENSNGYHILNQLTENTKYDHSTYPSDSGMQIHSHHTNPLTPIGLSLNIRLDKKHKHLGAI